MANVTININMDEDCQKCGKKGATQSGWCLGCLADNTGKVKHSEDVDPMINEAIELLGHPEKGAFGISLLQRRLKIGYSRANRMMDRLEKMGLIIQQKIETPESKTVQSPASRASSDWKEVPNSVVHLAQEIIRAFHPELLEARIGFLFKTTPQKSGGKRVWGKATKVNPRLQVYIDLDFIIWLDEETYSDLPEERRKALIDHELCHCDFSTGEAKIKHHDFEEFHVIVERYGAWNHELLHLQSIFPDPAQRRMPGLQETSRRGAVVAMDPGKMPAA